MAHVFSQLARGACIEQTFERRWPGDERHTLYALRDKDGKALRVATGLLIQTIRTGRLSIERAAEKTIWRAKPKTKRRPT